MLVRREYSVKLFVYGQWINKVIIDPHYEQKHGDTINDDIIVALVKSLDGKMLFPEKQTPLYSYFVTDQIGFNGRFYKLIWLLEENNSYVGVINAYRR